MKEGIFLKGRSVELMQLTGNNAANLFGPTSLEEVIGENPDISQYLDFGCYNWVLFQDNACLDVTILVRFIGIADSEKKLISFYILLESRIPVTAGTV